MRLPMCAVVSWVVLMWTARDVLVAPLGAPAARRFIQQHHYSGSVVKNSQIHLGVWLPDKRLHGVMQFGPPMVKRNVLGLVRGTAWHNMLELNRMAFDAALPRNSESRALGVALRMIRRKYPNIEWVLSFADATRCGDGTIYRASGFVLTEIRVNTGMGTLAGKFVSRMTLTKAGNIRSNGGRASLPSDFAPLPGFMLRYIYFLEPKARARLTVPVLPFSEIDRAGARMYRGERGGKNSSAGPTNGEGGVTPTPPLHPQLPLSNGSTRRG